MVWHVTDDTQVLIPESAAILEAVGIPIDSTYATTHFTDPNSSSPKSASVTPTTVLPATRPAAVLPLRAALEEAILLPAVFYAHHATTATLRVTLDFSPDRIRFTLARHGRTLIRLGARQVVAWASVIGLRLPALAPGSWLLRLSGGFGRQALTFEVVQKT